MLRISNIYGISPKQDSYSTLTFERGAVPEHGAHRLAIWLASEPDRTFSVCLSSARVTGTRHQAKAFLLVLEPRPRSSHSLGWHSIHSASSLGPYFPRFLPDDFVFI